MYEPSDAERLADFLKDQIRTFTKMGYEEFMVAEVLVALRLVEMDLLKGDFKVSGFVQMPSGIDKQTEAELLDELPTIIDENGEEIELDEEDEDDDD